MGERLQDDDVSFGQIGELSNKPAREMGKLASGASRAELLEIGLVDDEMRPGGNVIKLSSSSSVITQCK